MLWKPVISVAMSWTSPFYLGQGASPFTFLLSLCEGEIRRGSKRQLTGERWAAVINTEEPSV